MTADEMRAALTAALAEVPELDAEFVADRILPTVRGIVADAATDLEWAATKQDRPDVALGFTAAAGRIREQLGDPS